MRQLGRCICPGPGTGTGQAIRGSSFGCVLAGDASRLLTASSNRTARVMKLPLSRYGGEGTDLVGHNGPLHDAAWSHNGTMVLTASADRSGQA